MSTEWIRSLPLGAIILAPYRGIVEELTVVRTATKSPRYISVLVKRPHLKVPLPIRAVDNLVSYQFEARRRLYDYRKWKVIYPSDGSPAYTDHAHQ